MTPAIANAPGVPAPLPRPRAIGRFPIIDASGAAAAMTRKTIRDVESEARSFGDGDIGALVMQSWCYFMKKFTAIFSDRTPSLYRPYCGLTTIAAREARPWPVNRCG